MRLLCGVSGRPLLLAFCVSLMIMSLVNTQRLPCHIDHETNPSGPWSQATNGKNFGRTELELKMVSWHGLGRRNHKSYEPPGCHFAWRCIQATLTNTSCPTSWRAADLLYGPWTGRCEGGRHVKVPGHSNQREETPSQGRQSPTDGILTDRREAKFASPLPSPHISSMERPLPSATAVPQYHLSARSISG